MADVYKITLPDGNSYLLKDDYSRSQIAALLTRMSDLETVVLDFDPSDADAALYSLALRVTALESHALLDSGYPAGGPSNPNVSLDSTTGTLSIS